MPVTEIVIYRIIRHRGFMSDRSVVSPMCNLNYDKRGSEDGCGKCWKWILWRRPQTAPDLRVLPRIPRCGRCDRTVGPGREKTGLNEHGKFRNPGRHPDIMCGAPSQSLHGHSFDSIRVLPNNYSRTHRYIDIYPAPLSYVHRHIYPRWSTTNLEGPAWTAGAVTSNVRCQTVAAQRAACGVKNTAWSVSRTGKPASPTSCCRSPPKTGEIWCPC